MRARHRLVDALPVTVETRLQTAAARARLQEALAQHASIEEYPTAGNDRRLTGTADGDRIHLSFRNGGTMPRWRVAFDGVVAEGARGAMLSGVIDLPNRHRLLLINRLLAIAGAVVGVLIAVSISWWEGIAIAAIWVLGIFATEVEGELLAGDDAEILSAFLGRTLA
jgi:hypothetical protein